MTSIKERPILFSGAMVRALRRGDKTQTRRAIKGIEITDGHNPGTFHYTVKVKVGIEDAGRNMDLADLNSALLGILGHCPYGQPGDRLWVRETWGFTAKWPQGFQRQHIEYGGPWLPEAMAYRADEPAGNYDWRPSIFMPRWACRLVLEITSVRVERLQSISEADATAEGIAERFFYGGHQHPDHVEYKAVQPPYGDGEKKPLGTYANYLPAKKDSRRDLSPVESYETLWASINGPESWAANPWVWVVEFNVVAGGSSPILTTSEKEVASA